MHTLASATNDNALAALCERFDRVYCLSLPGSSERRAWVERHLAEVGIHHFEYFDATGRDDPAVARLYDHGRVARYPTCFRCGALSCGRDDCNNVLIEAQVATFISYLRLWRRIVNQGVGRALILEDDVRFTGEVNATSAWLLDQGLLDDGRFGADVPALLRLGWARSAEHDSGLAPALLEDAVRMSNPLHAITGAFAARLLDRFERCDTTADIYQHERIAAGCAAYTVVPPLADELSWSEGAVDSLIHPKRKRIAYLERESPADGARIAAARAALQTHRAHVDYRPLAVTAAPASSVQAIVATLQAHGVEAGSDGNGRDGIVAPLPVSGGTLPGETFYGLRVLALNDPRLAIPALVDECRADPPTYQSRRELLRAAINFDLDACDPHDAAAIAWIGSNAVAESRGVDFRWRLEDGAGPLLQQLDRATAPPQDLGVALPDVAPMDDTELVRALRDDVVVAVNEQCERYGYRPIET